MNEFIMVMHPISIVFCIITIGWTVYDILRMKYMVFGIVIDPGKGARNIAEKKFRNRNQALAYYNECLKTYPNAQIYCL